MWGGFYLVANGIGLETIVVTGLAVVLTVTVRTLVLYGKFGGAYDSSVTLHFLPTSVGRTRHMKLDYIS